MWDAGALVLLTSEMAVPCGQTQRHAVGPVGLRGVCVAGFRARDGSRASVTTGLGKHSVLFGSSCRIPFALTTSEKTEI